MNQITADEVLSQHDCKAEKCSTCLMVNDFVAEKGTGEDGFHQDAQGDWYINVANEGENGDDGAYQMKKIYLK